MRRSIQAARLCVLLSAAGSTAAGSTAAAAPVQPGRSSVAAAPAAGTPRLPALRPRGQSCAGSPSFIGIDPSGEPNFAGTGSGVVAGYGNSGCDVNDFVGSGASNVVENDYWSLYSGIGSGTNNLISTAPQSFVGAGRSNAVAGYFFGAQGSLVAGGQSNYIGVDFSAIVAGTSNDVRGENPQCGCTGDNAFIGAGAQNDVAAMQSGLAAGINIYVGSSDYSFAGAGKNNSLELYYADAIAAGAYNLTQSKLSLIGAGESNSSYGSTASAIGAGYSNKTSGPDSFIGAGYTNKSAGTSAFVGAGRSDSGSGSQAFAGAGESNVAAGADSAILAGSLNQAEGFASFAGGVRAFAGTNGTFVWGDDAASASASLESSGANQFLVRSTGGTFFYSSPQGTCGFALGPGASAWTPLGTCGAQTAARLARRSEHGDVADLRAENRALAARVARLEAAYAVAKKYADSKY